jgi:hypothetical protein
MKKILLYLGSFLIGILSYGQIIITEIADPNDNAAARFVELYNLGITSVDFSTGWKINRYTNESATPQTAEALTGTIEPGGFYIISNGASNFNSAYGFDPDQDIGAGDAADSNGDDQIFILNPSDEIVDFFGVPGEDGSLTCHEFEDGRAERKATVTQGVSTFEESEWNIWADSGVSGCTSHTNDPQNVIDMDPGSWIGQPATSNPEPANHVASFVATASGPAQIDLVWSDNSGSPASEGFVLLASTGTITAPTDGVELLVDGDLSDGNAVIDINPGTESYSFTSLLPSTAYNFEIYSYSNFGANIDYKTDGTVPSQSVSTTASTYSPGDIVISEIMYNSISSDEEWIELYNGSGGSITLDSDWEITNANPAWSYTFDGTITLSSGAYVTLQVGTSGSFPFTPDLVISGSSNKLVNSSSTIILIAQGVTIDNVTYTDDMKYPDNTGTTLSISLSLGSLTADNSDMTYWVGSASDGGTPGGANDVTSWTATSSSEWMNAGNWSNGLPSANLSAVVPSGGSNPTIADDVAVASLKIAPGIILLVSAGTATINGEFVFDGAAEVLSGGALAILSIETGTGNITVFRNTTGSGGYSILGAPIAGAQLADLSADYLYGYDEVNSLFTAATGAMTAGAGYFVGFDAASPSVSFTGTPNSGTVTTALSFGGDGFNLVANPYAAAISMSMYRASNSTDTDGAIYLWDDGGTNEGADRGGDYITVNDVGAVSTVDLAGTGLTGEGPAGNGFIASTQGFFVKALAAGSVTFTPDMQSTTSGANADVNHYRQAEEKQLLRLSISGNGLYNEILLGLMESATLGVDRGLDATKFSGNELISFYSMIDDSKFAIQALPNVFDQLLEVQLGLDLAEAGTYTFNVNELQGIADDMDVTLFDNVTGLSYNLSEVESITFTNAASSFNDQRFKLVLSKAAVLGFDLNKSSDAFKVFMNVSGLNIETKFVFDNAEVNIYTLSGALVNTYHKVDFSIQKSTIPFNRNGLFIITIQTDDQLMVKKFLN